MTDESDVSRGVSEKILSERPKTRMTEIKREMKKFDGKVKKFEGEVKEKEEVSPLISHG